MAKSKCAPQQIHPKNIMGYRVCIFIGIVYLLWSISPRTRGSESVLLCGQGERNVERIEGKLGIGCLSGDYKQITEIMEWLFN